LQCLASGTNCNCPLILGGNVCDCPTTRYWDGSTCRLRVGHNQNCINDYECTYNVGLICFKTSASGTTGTCQCANFYNEYLFILI
jgi:hypothetical protein